MNGIEKKPTVFARTKTFFYKLCLNSVLLKFYEVCQEGAAEGVKDSVLFWI